MRYLSSISLALIVHVLLSIVVLMVLACTATPSARTSILGASNYTDAEVLKALEDWSKASDSSAYVNRSCWASLDMGRKKYTVTQNPSNPSIYWVAGVGPTHTDSKLSHGILELTHPATWTVDMHPTKLSNYSTANFSKPVQVVPTSFDPYLRELGC